MSGKGNGRRRSLLELAPLELDCMNALWPMGEGTVREIRDWIAPHRPRAYTTIMTIMDRLARKGIVERHKAGRAYRYRPTLTAEDARVHALGQVMDGFFGGSAAAMSASLPDAREKGDDSAGFNRIKRDGDLKVGASSANRGDGDESAPVMVPREDGRLISAATGVPSERPAQGKGELAAEEDTPPTRLDTTLL